MITKRAQRSADKVKRRNTKREKYETDKNYVDESKWNNMNEMKENEEGTTKKMGRRT